MIFYYKWSRVLPVFFYISFILLLVFMILPSFIPEKNPVDLIAENESPAPVFFPEEYNLILAAYAEPSSAGFVISFFEGITGSRELAAMILDYAAKLNVAPSLAFSLCWEESRFNARAVNSANRNKTIDRGLFQLNSASFPMLTEDDFFDPAVNAYYGINHLRYCLDAAGTEIAGLAMYNAGAARVSTGGTPKMTLDYVSRIIKHQRYLEELFLDQYTGKIFEKPAQRKPVFSLSLLSPLGR